MRAPAATSDAVRASMRGNKSRDTKPELALRRALHARGLRFRVCHPVRVGPLTKFRADVVFTRRRVAVFVDGCFWHGCPDHYRAVKSNKEYWDAKVGHNILHDRATDHCLGLIGWRVVRVWEHEPVETQVYLVLAALVDSRP